MFFKKLALFVTIFCSVAFYIGRAQPKSTANSQSVMAKYEALILRYRYDKPDSAIFFARQAFDYAKANHDSNGIARILNQMGMISDNLGNPDEARQKYLQARSIYQETGSKKGQATETVRLGVVELRKGNYDKAIGFFLEALKISESIRDNAGQMEAYTTLAEGYIGQKDYDRALHYLKIAERLDADLPFSSLSLNICINFGIIYREKKEFPKAISYLKKGISLSNTPQLQGINITLMNNLAAVYAKAGRKSVSIALQKEALHKARAIHNYIRELQTLSGLAATYGKKQPDSALYYLNKALSLARYKNARRQEIDILQELSAIYKYQRNYKKALELKEQQHRLTDSFYYHAMSSKIADLQIEYELNRSRARVQELRFLNKQQEFERKIILSITGAIVILLLVVIFYFYKTTQLNRLLHKANSELRESNVVKDKIFSVLGHDLRSPISSLISMLYMMNDESLTAVERKAIVDKLAKSSRASLETLNQLLRWGEMQIKGIKLRQESFRPFDIIERNIRLLADASETKKIQVMNTVDPAIKVFADPGHFDFILRNLLSNAIKFTPVKGSIDIQAFTPQENNMVAFMVKDSGIGIESDRIDAIFNIDNTSTRGTNNEQGTSLGLLMCKEFIEANHGTISVHSEKGKGSEFVFTLHKVS